MWVRVREGAGTASLPRPRSRMDVITAMLNSVLFAEKCQPARARPGCEAHVQRLQQHFWEDAHNRNLRLQDVEIEFRFGACPEHKHGPFNPNVPKRVFERLMQGLQAYSAWDRAWTTRDVVSYFADLDESVRRVTEPSGTSRVQSKRKVTQADFRLDRCPLDMRLAVSVEIELDKPAAARFGYERATSSIIRERSSFQLGRVRYDLTRATDARDGSTAFRVEVELVDAPQLQLELSNATAIVAEVHERILNLLRILEPVDTLRATVLRRKVF